MPNNDRVISNTGDPEEAYQRQQDAVADAQQELQSRWGPGYAGRLFVPRRAPLPAGDPASESGIKVSYDELDEDLQEMVDRDIDPDTDLLGVPTDGTYDDGLLPFTPATKDNDAIDAINETLAYLIPSGPSALAGVLVPLVTIYTGKVSQSPLPLTSLSPGDTTNIIFDGVFRASPSPFGKADQGSLRAIIDTVEVDAFDMAAAFQEAERSGSQSYPPADSPLGHVHILAVAVYNSFPPFQQGEAEIRQGAAYGNSNFAGGEHSAQMTHDPDAAATGVYVLLQDPETGRPQANTPSFVEGAPVLTHLSGIRFYGLGSTFVVGFTAIRVFEYTYIDNPITLAMIALNTVTMALTDPAISGVSSPPVWNETLTAAGKVLTLDAAGDTDDLRVTVTPLDPRGTGTPAMSPSQDMLVDTHAAASTDTDEHFTDEAYRLPVGAYDVVPSPVTGQWNSTAVLTNGNAQVYRHDLVYPTQDFTTKLPTQQPGTDYSGFSGDQEYYRAIRDTVNPHNNGELRITGIVIGDLGTNVKVEIKLPGQTGWLDLGALFNVALFTGADGDGCQTGSSQDGDTLVLNWTSGTFSTAGSGNLYVVRITMLTSAKSIGRVQEAGW